MLQLREVKVSEAFQEETDEFFAYAGLCQLLQRDLVLQLVTRCLQFLQPAFRGFRQNALLDRVEQIVDAGVGLLELLLIHRQSHTLLILHGQHHRSDRVNGAVIRQHLHDRV